MLAFAFRDPATSVGTLIILWAAAQAIALPSQRNERLLVLSLLGLLGGWTGQVIAKALGSIPLPRYDLYIYAIDRMVGSPSFAIGAYFAHHPFEFETLRIVYDLLPVSVTAVLLMRAWTRRGLLVPIVAFVLNLLLAPAIYMLLPVCGPAYAFHRFPAQPDMVSIGRVVIHAPPNGVPSVHMSTALLVLYFAWDSKPAKLAAFIYLMVVAVSTMAVGEHYLFDLLCAIPYAICIAWLAKRLFSKRVPRVEMSSQQRAPSGTFAEQ